MEPKAPKTFEDFVSRYPELGEAWDALRRAERNSGPLDAKTLRLVKLGIAVGAQRSGGISSGVRKGLASGITMEEIEQVVACAASLIGMPATVAAFQKVRDTASRA